MSGESGHDLSNLKAAKTPIVEFIEGFSPTEKKAKLNFLKNLALVIVHR